MRKVKFNCSLLYFLCFRIEIPCCRIVYLYSIVSPNLDIPRFIAELVEALGDVGETLLKISNFFIGKLNEEIGLGVSISPGEWGVFPLILLAYRVIWF